MLEIPRKVNVDEDLLCYLYQSRDYTTRSLAKRFNISQRKVCLILKDNNIKTRLNEHKTKCQNNLKHGFHYLTKKYKKDNISCEICGWDETTLDLHHIIPLSKGGEHIEKNIICLCPNCHRMVHKKLICEDELNETKGR